MGKKNGRAEGGNRFRARGPAAFGKGVPGSRNRVQGYLGVRKLVCSVPPFESQVCGTAQLSPQHLGRNVAWCRLAALFVVGNGGSKDSLDFLNLPPLSLDLAEEHRAKGLHCIDAPLGFRDADRNCRV